MFKQPNIIWRRILFTVIFVVMVFSVFGITQQKNVFANGHEQNYCDSTYGGENSQAVPAAACNTDTATVYACEPIPNSDMVCRRQSDLDGNPTDDLGTAKDAIPPDTEGGNWFFKQFLKAFNYLVNLIFVLAAVILGIAGVLLNASIEYTIVGGTEVINRIGSIDSGWGAIRDVANILFIFLILYIAIATILRIDKFNAKNLLPKVVIAALLINFSLFFTKVIIDTSNIATNEFYQQLVSLAPNDNRTTEDGAESAEFGEVHPTGISGAFMNSLKLGTILKIDIAEDGGSVKSLVFQIMGSLFILVAAFTFGTVAFLLIIRFVLFIILMVTSPIGFVGGLLPQLGGLSGRWWKTLWDQALFAPAFMLLAFISFGIVRDMVPEGGSFTDAFDGGSPEVVLSFIIASAFLIASILIAKSLASTGSGKLVNTATKFGSQLSFGAAALAGRQTLGRIGAGVSNSDALKRIEAEGGAAGAAARLTLKGGRGLGTATFDSRNLGAVQGALGSTGIGKGGKGGFVDRQEAARKKAEKAAQERTKQYGAASPEAEQKYKLMQKELNDARQRYARKATPENEAVVTEAKGAFDKAKNAREGEIQQSRARAAQNEADSRVGGIWERMRRGGGAVRGRKEGLEKARDKAEQERNKAMLKENEKKLKELKRALGGDIDSDLKTVQEALEESERKLEEAERNIQGATGSTAGASFEKQKQDIEAAISTLRTKEEALQNKQKGTEYAQYQTLKKRVEAAKKQKQKEDTKKSIEELMKDIDKEKSGGDSEKKGSGGGDSGGGDDSKDDSK